MSDYPYEPSAPSNSRARQRGFVNVLRLSTKGVPLHETTTCRHHFHPAFPYNDADGDEYSEYQWALNNTGRLRRTEKVLNIKTLDHIYLHYGENGIDDIALPPLGPDNFESINTDAVANIDINIEDAWKTYSETENKRTVTVAIIDTGIDTTHSDLKD